jgi:hypothetical protein
MFSGTYAYLAHTTHSGRVTDLDGHDIIFTSDFAGSTQLDHEIETYNHETGALTFWVRIPTLDGDAPTVIYLFYGNSLVNTSQEDIPGTWNSSYKGVYHFAGLTDSTGINDLTGYNTPTFAAGKTGNAMYLVGASNQYAMGGDIAAQRLEGGNMVAEFWLWLDTKYDSDGFTGMFGKGGFTTGSRGITTNYSPTNMFDLVKPGVESQQVAYDLGATWNHITCVYTAGTGVTFYLNGANPQVVAGTTAANGSTGTNFAVGVMINATTNVPAGQFYLDGRIDEGRWYSGLQTADWVLTNYNTQSSPSTFYALGNEFTNYTVNYLKQYRRTRFPGSITGI